MNQYLNEDAAWQRLKDVQREYENSRLLAVHGWPALVHLSGLIVRRAWWLAGLAMQRAPRRSPAASAPTVAVGLELANEDCDVAPHAA
ncbi:MAG TPA: hypothetical protein VJT78_06420 [Candidatus Dormibacteraeota bacterium]|nr:hypothetical protein [Candidatus Dormibacteraeota bacterium]